MRLDHPAGGVERAPETVPATSSERVEKFTPDPENRATGRTGVAARQTRRVVGVLRRGMR
jgi:hypothetical protein